MPRLLGLQRLPAQARTIKSQWPGSRHNTSSRYMQLVYACRCQWYLTRVTSYHKCSCLWWSKAERRHVIVVIECYYQVPIIGLGSPMLQLPLAYHIITPAGHSAPLSPSATTCLGLACATTSPSKAPFLHHHYLSLFTRKQLCRGKSSRNPPHLLLLTLLVARQLAVQQAVSDPRSTRELRIDLPERGAAHWMP